MNPLLRRLRDFWKALFRDEAFRKRMRFFREVFLFQGLNDHALAHIAQASLEKSYAADEPVFEEGDVGRAVFIVAEGRVRLSQTDKRTGQAHTVTEVGPGEFFGEMVLLDELPRSATARAVEPSRLYILYKSSFDTLITDAPHVASKVLHTLARLLSARLRREMRAADPRPVASGADVL